VRLVNAYTETLLLGAAKSVSPIHADVGKWEMCYRQ